MREITGPYCDIGALVRRAEKEDWFHGCQDVVIKMRFSLGIYQSLFIISTLYRQHTLNPGHTYTLDHNTAHRVSNHYYWSPPRLNTLVTQCTQQLLCEGENPASRGSGRGKYECPRIKSEWQYSCIDEVLGVRKKVTKPELACRLVCPCRETVTSEAVYSYNTTRTLSLDIPMN